MRGTSTTLAHLKEAHGKVRELECENSTHTSETCNPETSEIETYYANQDTGKCDHCTFETSNKSILEQHINSEHENDKQISCKQCKYTATSLFQLKSHIDKVHFKKTKQVLKKALDDKNDQQSYEKVSELIKQGHFLRICHEEKQDATWKSFILDMKKNTAKFLVNACLDTLPTNSNLNQWGKRNNDKCQLCGNRETTFHVLNGCKVALEQKRYNFRHDSIIKYISKCIDPKFQLYCDINGKKTTAGGTIPPSVIVTNLKPDIVILDGGSINIFELTCPFTTRIHKAHNLKDDKYAHLETDITSYVPSLNIFEVCSRGLITNENKARLKSLHRFCRKSIKFTEFLKNISKLSITASYYTFLARKEPIWNDMDLITLPT